MDLRCIHEQTRYVRVIAVNGTAHVMEQCLQCQGNARGAGKWVPRSEITCMLDELPVLKDNRSDVDKGEQPLLFD